MKPGSNLDETSIWIIYINEILLPAAAHERISYDINLEHIMFRCQTVQMIIQAVKHISHLLR